MKAYWWRIAGRVFAVRARVLRARADVFEKKAEKFFGRVKARAEQKSGRAL